ncbi:metallopeptidase family protein [Candidatus Saccharibacteria bacterium]|nr:MAG: metallopeptidase family protein [Candidatus Saccharibacteria bacterium]
MEATDKLFHELIDRAFDSLPQIHRDRVRNVAIVTADEPTPLQRQELKLHCNQTLLGLYSGIPLPQRQGREPLVPDVITLFKLPLLAESDDEAALYENIRHTLWHEVAHYYGLDHDQIHKLER